MKKVPVGSIKELKEKVPAFAVKIQPIYQLLNWKWQGLVAYQVPQVEDIEKRLYDLLDELKEESVGTSINTGGLRVFSTNIEGMEIEVGMEFRISEIIREFED